MAFKNDHFLMETAQYEDQSIKEELLQLNQVKFP